MTKMLVGAASLKHQQGRKMTKMLVGAASLKYQQGRRNKGERTKIHFTQPQKPLFGYLNDYLF